MFSESVSQGGWGCRSWLAISSLEAPLETSTSILMILMKEFLFLICFISLSSHLQLSIYMYYVCEACIRGVSVDLCEALLFETRRQKSCLFSLFYVSTTFCWYCECTQIKVDPFQFRMMYYAYLHEQKWQRTHWKKMQVIALAPPCPAKRALASTLHTNYWIQRTFI